MLKYEHDFFAGKNRCDLCMCQCDMKEMCVRARDIYFDYKNNIYIDSGV